MAHFAKLGKGNKVEQVIVVSNDVATTEQAGVDFINNLYGTNDISNLNGNNGGSDAGGMTTTGLTALKSNVNIQSTAFDTGTFTNNTFYRYYVIRVDASGSGYDWGLQRLKYYGDYY